MINYRRALKHANAKNERFEAQVAQLEERLLRVQRAALDALKMVNQRDQRIAALEMELENALSEIQLLNTHRAKRFVREHTIIELHHEGLSKNAIQRRVFSYTGGGAYREVARVLRDRCTALVVPQ